MKRLVHCLCVHHSKRIPCGHWQLARVYLRAWQMAGCGFFRTVSEGIPDDIIRAMTDSTDGLSSIHDAESDTRSVRTD